MVKVYIWSTALCDAENWTLQEVDLKYLESIEMCCWRTNGISWTDHVRNEEVWYRVTKERSILHEIKEGILNVLVMPCVGTGL